MITWASPVAITYGTVLSGTQLNASTTVPGAFVYAPPSGTVLNAGVHQTLGTTFTPTDTVNYTTATTTVYLDVNKATPVITWATPAAITYGTALSATQLNASTTVAGSFLCNPVSGTVPPAGTLSLGTTFTPTDTANYTTATKSVSLRVNKATPVITWATPAAITYGTALSGTQLNASTTVAGSFLYNPASGTVPSAGTVSLGTIFTPTDTANYTTATASVSLTVNKATPVITWATPVAITYGTALSATQLNASTTVAGSFLYNPMSGSVPSAGTLSLGTTFTPTDTANFTTATKSVSLTVNKAVPEITWLDPAAIIYGTVLSGTQLNAAVTATVNGVTSALDGSSVYAYTPSSGILNAGTNQPLTVTFTPTDTANFTPATATVHITVNQATPGITWPPPDAIVYGTPLNGSQLNASTPVGGFFVYDPLPGAVLVVGTSTLHATLTPTDTVNYTTATASVDLTVTKATPVISWAPQTAEVTFGTLLSVAQLNATTLVAGTFSYNQPVGTLLPAGTQTLIATFTPTDM